MTRTHTAKIEIRRWKAHACVACDCQYAYWMVRKLAYGGSTPERATEKAQAAAERAMAHEVDRQPCPTCGMYQPDMIAGRRRKLHICLLAASLLAVVLLGGLYLGDVVQADRTLAVAMGQIAFFAVLGFLVDFHNLNRNLEANRRAAEQEIAEERLRVIRPGIALTPVLEPRAPRLYGRLAIGLAILAILSPALPELMRMQAGWPLNADWYPPVAGPGDETCYYLPDEISSIKGFWTGTSKVTAQVAGESAAGELAVASFTRQADWGRSIQAQPGEHATSARPWVRLKLPGGESYAGKSLACKIALSVRYPVVHNDAVFATVAQDYQGEATLKLAAPLAARTYRTWWWSGFSAGAVLLIASMITRLAGAEALQRTAKPASILEEENQ